MEQKKNLQYLKYALGEVILVVLGVVIALQLNNWNQDRKDREEEQSIITDLLVEFKENKEALAFARGFQKTRMTAIYEVLTTTKVSDYSLERLDSMAWTVASSWTFNPSLGIYNSLISSGKIDLLRNPTLKNRIAKFKDAANDYSEDEQQIVLLTDTYLNEWFINEDNMFFDTNLFLRNRKRTKAEEKRDRAAYFAVRNDRKYKRVIILILAYIRSFDEEGDKLLTEVADIVDLLEAQANK